MLVAIGIILFYAAFWFGYFARQAVIICFQIILFLYY
jgi:hypothetical protein